MIASGTSSGCTPKSPRKIPLMILSMPSFIQGFLQRILYTDCSRDSFRVYYQKPLENSSKRRYFSRLSITDSFKDSSNDSFKGFFQWLLGLSYRKLSMNFCMNSLQGTSIDLLWDSFVDSSSYCSRKSLRVYSRKPS